jgi:hypothetical protein
MSIALVPRGEFVVFPRDVDRADALFDRNPLVLDLQR